MDSPSPRIQFREYTRNVPPNIPVAIQSATRRLIASRAHAVAQIPNWEEWRQRAHDTRLETLLHLDDHVAQLESRIAAYGGHVHMARDAAEACSIITGLAREHRVTTAVKGKSMASEEIGLNHALERAGIRAVETDVGEFIIQMAGIGPAHILGPAAHLTKEEIAELFTRKLGVDAAPDPRKLTDIARDHLRGDFLHAEMGITGANFIVAETGTVALVTNEGNGRMCSTLPDVYIAVAGIDKIVPDLDTLELMLRLLARNATGQSLSCYTSLLTGPRRESEQDGPREFHLVLLDNGRRRILQDPVMRETLLCIRCAACLNICPVYNHVGGHAYGWVYSGPIGAILSPQLLGTQVARELPFASSLCGACADICPVKIPIPKILLQLRRRVSEGDAAAKPCLPATTRLFAHLSTMALATPPLYRFGSRLIKTVQAPFRRGNWLPALFPPLDRWTGVRPMPAFSPDFRAWWKTKKSKTSNPKLQNQFANRVSTLAPRPAPRVTDHPSSINRHQAPIDNFLQQVNNLGAHGESIKAEALDAALHKLVQAEGIKTATLWATEGLRQLHLETRLAELGVSIIPPNASKNELAQADLGITEGDYLLPDTGSLGLVSAPDKPRATSLLPRVHLAFVQSIAVRSDLAQVLRQAGCPSSLVFITGPSRTSDIESSPVLGAHGPKSLYVWAVE